jgi:serine/threonine protein phosphatase PrpC
MENQYSDKENQGSTEICLQDATITSKKSSSMIAAYAACTTKGLVKGTNEDRVSIIANLKRTSRREDRKTWPHCAFFAVYDGHGGHNCSAFLQENLHHFITEDENFPLTPERAIIAGFRRAEQEFLETTSDNSGSCANVSLIVGDRLYQANVGDSRALMSLNSGKSFINLSRDHKPMDE